MNDELTEEEVAILITAPPQLRIYAYLEIQTGKRIFILSDDQEEFATYNSAASLKADNYGQA